MAKGINSPIPDNQFFSVEETANLLGVTSQTVSNYLRAGQLKGQKKGPKQKWHIPGVEIKRKRKEWNLD